MIVVTNGFSVQRMSKQRFMFFAFVLVVVVSCGREPLDSLDPQLKKEGKKDKTIENRTPRETLEKLVFLRHDFGFLAPDSVSTCELSLLNDKLQPMSLESYKPSCRCISMEKMPDMIPPGERGTFVIKLDTSGKRGVTMERIVFFGKDTMVVAEVNAIVKALWADPDVIDLGDLVVGTVKEADAFVLAGGYPEARISSVTVDDNWLEVTQHVANTDEKTLSRKIKAIAKLSAEWTGADLPPGRISSRINIATDAVPDKSIHVRVLGHVLGKVTVVPSRLQFGKISPDKTVTRTCTLSFGAVTFDPRDIECSTEHEFVEAAIEFATSAEKEQFILSVTMETAQDGGDARLVRGAVRGKRKDTGTPIFSVPYVGYMGTR